MKRSAIHPILNNIIFKFYYYIFVKLFLLYLIYTLTNTNAHSSECANEIAFNATKVSSLNLYNRELTHTNGEKKLLFQSIINSDYTFIETATLKAIAETVKSYLESVSNYNFKVTIHFLDPITTDLNNMSDYRFTKLRKEFNDYYENEFININDYDIICLVNNINTNKGSIGGKVCAVDMQNSGNLYETLNTTIHEIGHVLGLGHAYSKTKTTEFAQSQFFEYGHPGDPMGGVGYKIKPSNVDQFTNSYSDIVPDYNPYFKFFLGWIQEEEIETVTNSKTITLHPHEKKNQSETQPKCIRIPVCEDIEYWLYLNTHNPEILHKTIEPLAILQVNLNRKNEPILLNGVQNESTGFLSYGIRLNEEYYIPHTDIKISYEQSKENGTIKVNIQLNATPPLISHKNTFSNFKYLDDLHLEFDIKGAIPRKVYWLKNGIRILGYNQPILKCKTLQDFDSGQYTLCVENQYGKSTLDLDLKIETSKLNIYPHSSRLKLEYQRPLGFTQMEEIRYKQKLDAEESQLYLAERWQVDSNRNLFTFLDDSLSTGFYYINNRSTYSEEVTIREKRFLLSKLITDKILNKKQIVEFLHGAGFASFNFSNSEKNYLLCLINN